MKFLYVYLPSIVIVSALLSAVALLNDNDRIAIAGFTVFAVSALYGLYLLNRKDGVSGPVQIKFKPIRTNIMLPCAFAAAVSIAGLYFGSETVAGVGSGVLGMAVGGLIKLEETIISLESDVEN